jgi:excisionase family DNA binding protein
MPDEANDIPASQEVLRVLRQIEEHLAALRNGAHNAASQWLTIDEVAKELRLSRDTVERLIAVGKLRAAEVSTSAGQGARHRYRVRRDWIDEFLDGSVRPSHKAVRDHPRSGRLRSRVDFIG